MIAYDAQGTKYTFRTDPDSGQLCAWPYGKDTGYATACYRADTLEEQSGKEMTLWDAPPSNPNRKVVGKGPEEPAPLNLQTLYKQGPITAETLQQIAPAVRAAVGESAACVILAWMGGAPPDGFFKQYSEGLPTEWYAKYVPVVAQIGQAAGWLGKQVGGGKIYTIKDACPNGPTIDVALDKLKKADPALWDFCAAKGQRHRDDLARQMEKEGDAAGAQIFKTAGNRVGDVLSGLDSLLTAFTTVVKYIVPIGIGAALLFFVLPRLRGSSPQTKTQGQ